MYSLTLKTPLMNSLPKVKISIEDRLLSQDRWIVFLLFLGMVALAVFVYEAHSLNTLLENELPRELLTLN